MLTTAMLTDTQMVNRIIDWLDRKTDELMDDNQNRRAAALQLGLLAELAAVMVSELPVMKAQSTTENA